MDTGKKGKASEYAFIARCLFAGLDCYTPVAENGRVDVLVGETLQRCQVKTLVGGGLPLRKCGYKSNVKVRRYTAEQVDFMIGVDAQTMDIFVVPSTIFKTHRNNVSINTLRRMGLVNNIELLKSKTAAATNLLDFFCAS